ncbi:methyl-accepting chemotaxis protein [Paenibacillus turpanensis]|uniref:methyl-accepting chemotaxis protein n=1 Tax=Paenibacillus turpanensis TaxID=2689078 RepID=UPI001408685E|nr:methyl-accepting chemotaxis protein [Paenibacillus turpanensis]
MKQRLWPLHMRGKLTLLFVGAILSLIVIVSFVAYQQITKGMKQIYEERVKAVSQLGYNWLDRQYPGNWSVRDGKLFKGDFEMNGNDDFVDSMSSITGGTVTIFLGDTRISTNVKLNGERAVGTQADSKITDVVLKTGESFLGEADILGKKHLTLYRPIKDGTGTIIGMWLVGPTIDAIQSHVRVILIEIVLAMLLTGLLFIAAIVLLVRRVIRPLLLVNAQMAEIADGEGDLTKEIHIRSKDEAGMLALTFNRMLGSLQLMIRQVDITAKQVAASSEQLHAGAEQTSQATEHIAGAVHEVANGAEQQVRSIEESAAAMKRMAEDVIQVTGRSEEVSVNAEEAMKRAGAGVTSLEAMNEHMRFIEAKISGLSSSIEKLTERSAAIGRIVDVISSISQETNLLALNAAIESARAGEHGLGFAVVAGEVRKLAEQSAKSAREISELISSTQEDTQQVSASMLEAANEIQGGSHYVQQANESFQAIQSSVHKVADQLSDIRTFMKQMTDQTGQVNRSIELIAGTALSAAESSQQASAATQEQLAAMEEVSASSASLADLAGELQRLTARFKV